MEGQMQVVHFTDQDLGSLDWELSKVMSDHLDLLPLDTQHYVRHAFEVEMKAFMLVLMGWLSSRHPKEYQDAMHAHHIRLCGELMKLHNRRDA
jgi:hypothetical protein